ncbi:MAG: FKBP-type peptidyl-prolyl cis-trans isomerase [Clostridia bacterium]|nr:FKBP-type peptidyl-prolyl cis-trans isomerase [Clostridia bacterium]
MKKISLILLLIVACSVLLCSCGKEPYDFDLTEYVSLGTFPAVEYNKANLDKKVNDAVEAITTEYKEEKDITDRAVEDGDNVTIDYSGILEGETEPFEGGTAQNQSLLIGSNTFIDGFEDGLIGKKVGEEVKLDLVFPEDYSTADYAGKKVVFTVTVKGIKDMVVPELTDEMVKDEGEYETVEQFMEATKKNALEEMVWESFVDSCKVNKYPEKEVKEYYDNLIAMYRQISYSNGISLANYVSIIGYGSEENFYAEILSGARESVKEEMIIYLTVRNNNITISDEQYKTIATEIALEEGYESLEEFEDLVEKVEIKKHVYKELIIDKIIENAVGVDGEVTIEDDEHEGHDHD